MRLSASISSALVLLAASAVHAASPAWSFDDGSLLLTSKGSSEHAKREKLDAKTALSAPITLGSQGSVKISLTTTENAKAKRPHQAFVILREDESGLEAPFPMTVKENGKASVTISQKEIPIQLLLSPKPIEASVVIGSFGPAAGLNTPIFSVRIQPDPTGGLPEYEKPLRYGKKPEIQHIFRADPRNPPKIASLFFALLVAAVVPALFLGWVFLGANLNHLPTALGAAPVSHTTFLGSIVAMEFVFFMYYTSWNLLETLPVIAIVGAVTVLSGTKALGEVQSRRLAGQR